MRARINPLTMRGINEASEAIERALADPNRPGLFFDFRQALLASNPYEPDDEMHGPWHHAAATQLVSVRAGWPTLSPDQEPRLS